MRISRIDSIPSFGLLSMSSEKDPKNKVVKTIKFILKILIFILVFGIILYLFIGHENFDTLFEYDRYLNILNNYDSYILYVKILLILSDYRIFIILFTFGFCIWNVYKSYIHFIGFFFVEYSFYLLKLLFKREPKILSLNNNKDNIPPESLRFLCEITSGYEFPSFRAANVMYSLMSFIALLFKEKKIKYYKKAKIILSIIFFIIGLVLNAGLILLLQNSISSLIIGGAVGFIIYFFMFNILKINYDRSEQLLFFMNIDIIFFIILNIALLLIMVFLRLLVGTDEEIDEKYEKLCHNTNFNYKSMSYETFFQSLFFFCNLTMMMSLKLQRKFIFTGDGNFVSVNFNVEEISEQNNLMSRISISETYKFDKKIIWKYLAKVFLCLGMTFVFYLLFLLLDHFRGESYIVISIIEFVLPINCLIIFLFLLSKPLFIYLDLEFSNDSE